MKLNFKWERKQGRYQNGEYLSLNGIVIGDFEWNAVDGSKEGKRWSCTIHLPQYKIPDAMAYRPDEEAARAIIEKVATKWFEKVLTCP